MLLPRRTSPVIALALLLAACAPPGLVDQDGASGLYVVRVDGSGLALLAADASEPAWSPDGTRLAFVGREGETSTPFAEGDIYVVNADGSGRTQAWAVPGHDFLPAWSPDGTRLAFNNYNYIEGGDLYVGQAGGSHPAQVARLMEIDPGAGASRFFGPHTPAVMQRPAWSPDGAKIAFGVELADGESSVVRSRIDVVGVDGAGRERATDTPQAAAPAWSPDGTRIAFVSGAGLPGGRGSIAGAVHVVAADGSRARQLTDVSPYPAAPAWSPDGARLLFAGGADGRMDVYVANADGSGLTNLTNDDHPDADPSWSPDGGAIAFASYRDGWDVYVMNADGSGGRRVAGTGRDDRWPDWSPDGTVIAFASWPEDEDSYRD